MKTIITGIPIGHDVNSVVDGYTVMNMPNAQVVSNTNVSMTYLNGAIVPNGYASPGNPIKILEIFENKLLVLIPINTNNTEWVIGYMDFSVLPTQVQIKYNTITWFNNSDKSVFDSNGTLIYQLPSSAPIQFLYETQDNNHMCILFNDSNGALRTGYVSKNTGVFLRYDYLPSREYPLAPKVLTNNLITYSKLNKSNNILKIGNLSLNLSSSSILNFNSQVIYKNNISQNLIDFVKLKEGFSKKAYEDISGNLTIGYGHKIVPGDGFNIKSVISIEEATNLLINDLSSIWTITKNLINNNFPEFEFHKQYQIDAIIDLAYNNGPIIADNSIEHSIFRDSINQLFENLQFDFIEWCHGSINGQEKAIFGLYKRKLEDYILFSSGIFTNFNATCISELENELNYKSIYSNFYY